MSMNVYDVLRTATTSRDRYFESILVENQYFPLAHAAFIQITDAKNNEDVEDLTTLDIEEQVRAYLKIPPSFFNDEDSLRFGDELDEYHELVETATDLIEGGRLADEVHVFKVTDDETLIINGDLFGV
ncbi:MULTISPECIES: hypothetical protein [Loigolactobacillus]|uniref:Uncharacterized protein n=1 Tax=Loigolactobacillus backii TaxID=375175 RepID=A0A192H0R7_9LACO|nr:MULTISPECIES: hypothetical protein [Loigolactobacillus]ANK60594.1 hypothetical protein AYR52_10235 [Loigolactobacillus backii]ANK61837.1 hypothetical protein AYR53_03070 [Loigolactobacillus backii]ANK65547.1 hypothetical protein AYR54_10040 [Loigolactobacillus backii]ANK68018.1 hypothetical protein AYR55_10160 [Loigolactobacillus backii]ANK68969.1 hypothetical protein AYR56_01655 [Loigolactobacillus backii]